MIDHLFPYTVTTKNILASTKKCVLVTEKMGIEPAKRLDTSANMGFIVVVICGKYSAFLRDSVAFHCTEFRNLAISTMIEKVEK